MSDIFFNGKKKVLVLAPHTDDGEFGCGGTISRLIQMGLEVMYVAFSACEESLPEEMPKDTLKNELKDAASSLGIKPENVIIFNFPVRYFTSHRQPILEEMVKINRSFSPDIVFLPCTNDTHQDHQVISNEGFRAFKRCTVLGYELHWNIIEYAARCFVELSSQDFDNKVTAIQEYKSQANRMYSSTEVIKSTMVMRGSQIGKQFAESFEVLRIIL